MTVPVATYRLQLRGGMTFADAGKLAPYLAKLGISHVYLSPIFQAAPESTHGYDATDFNQVDATLGGLEGFLTLVDELNRHALKVILDFVPNHMAAHPANPWWHDVLEWGSQSGYSRHFDINWSAPKLLLPMLGQQYGVCLRNRELSLDFTEQSGEFAARYFETRTPLCPRSYGQLLALTDDHELGEIGDAISRCRPEAAAQLKQELSRLANSKKESITRALDAVNADPNKVHIILEEQVWRLAYWRTAREMLTHRRFFEISDLVGVRVENPGVFADVHRTVLSLIRDGKIDGLRIDHIDGLADPLKYLRDLRQATSGIPDFYMVVEKILGRGEDVRPEWPIDGTTGYEFIRDIAGLFVADDLSCLDTGYREFTDAPHDYPGETLDVKRKTLAFNLASELNGLASMAVTIAQADIATRDFGYDALRRAIIEIAAHFSVYRTYVDAAGPSQIDIDILQAVAKSTKAERRIEDHSTIDFIIAVLASPPEHAAAQAFAIRFQQTTGPLMAKAVEDTEFYRFNRLIALNEVGGDPSVTAFGPDRFHASMLRRQSLSPRALTATATHDTKRGEDARTRIYAISTFQEQWCEAVQRWSAGLNERGRVIAPDREVEWLFYQALAGAWPHGSDPSEHLGERMVQFMIKAAREAKQHTSWTNVDGDYEKAIETFVRAALQAQDFVEDFSSTIQPLIAAGEALSLVQAVLKIFAPGIPDIYQGTELWDLSLVDPDNRRTVDYGARTNLLSGSGEREKDKGWLDGSLKLELLQKSLAVRKKLELTKASYEPLTVEGDASSRVIAFARRSGDDIVIVIGTVAHAKNLPVLQGTRVQVPQHLSKRRLANAFSGTMLSAVGDHMDVAQVLESLPVAVLHSVA